MAVRVCCTACGAQEAAWRCGATNTSGTAKHSSCLTARHLQGEIAEEYAELQEQASLTEGDAAAAAAAPEAVAARAARLDALLGLAREMVPYCMGLNAEAEACDLLMEVCCCSCAQWL